MTHNPYNLNVISRFSAHRVISENIGKNKTVLDVGCNDGYLGLISDSTNKFYGLDYLQNSIEKAQKHYQDAIVYDLNYLTKLPWNIKYDVIVFADVLEHVLYPDKVLKYFCVNYLKDNGKVLISLPNIANWQIRLNLLFGKFEYTETGIMDKTHLHLYTYKTAKNLVINTHFLKIESVLYGASFFGKVIRLFPFLKTLLATNIILVCRKKIKENRNYFNG